MLAINLSVSHLKEYVTLGVAVLLAGVMLIDKLSELPVDLPDDVLQLLHPVTADNWDPVNHDDGLDPVRLLGLLPHDLGHQFLVRDVIHEVIWVIEVGFLAVVEVIIVRVVLSLHILFASHILLFSAPCLGFMKSLEFKVHLNIN